MCGFLTRKWRKYFDFICLIFSHNQPFRQGRGGCTWPGGGMHRGGGGDARASCASPLGTPLSGTKFFWRDIQKFFPQNVHLGPIRWVPKRFFTIWIFYSQNLHFNMRFLSIRRINFHVSASGKILTVFTCTIYAEHTGKWFYRILSIRGNDFKHWLSIGGYDFIADWAYTEMFKSRISHSNRIRFSKISCYRPLGP